MKKKHTVRGSFTIEAAIMVPFILFTIVSGIQLSYKLHQEAKSATEIRQEIMELDAVKVVRRNQMIHQAKEQLGSKTDNEEKVPIKEIGGE